MVSFDFGFYPLPVPADAPVLVLAQVKHSIMLVY
jgi:hypothetical protein